MVKSMKLRGKVVQGLGIGAKFGYPTANLEIDGPQDIESGVYAAHAVVNRAVHHAVAVVGARQEKSKPLVEVLLLDFDGDLYRKELEVEVLKKISEIERFENEEQLVEKIKQDVKRARVCLQG